jgi:hypothetical protein
LNPRPWPAAHCVTADQEAYHSPKKYLGNENVYSYKYLANSYLVLDELCATMAGTLLGQGAGYGIIIGFGALFALGMWGLAILLAKFHNEVQGSEMFMTAKRSVRTGLVASAVVSSWTIAATLLTSSTWAFEFGVSGAYYYGAGATVQIFVSQASQSRDRG